jgi:pimeloyl-ACP methyl ester carboxylesterase
VVAYDHRGQGLSGHPAYGYRMARLAVDAHEVIEALGLSDVTVIAHSMGCGVAFAYWDLYRDDRQVSAPRSSGRCCSRSGRRRAC